MVRTIFVTKKAARQQILINIKAMIYCSAPCFNMSYLHDGQCSCSQLCAYETVGSLFRHLITLRRMKRSKQFILNLLIDKEQAYLFFFLIHCVSLTNYHMIRQMSPQGLGHNKYSTRNYAFS